jgi:Flp pilus assembly protein TadB
VVNDRLRIADADRETAAHELGEHFALGRITVEEHAERLEQIWAARTAADLAPAFRDLPRPAASRTRPGSTARETPGGLGGLRGLGSVAATGRGWRPAMPHVPFLFKALLAIIVLWWGFHHLLFLLVAALVYVVLVRRLVRRGRGRGRPGRWGHSRYQAGWH